MDGYFRKSRPDSEGARPLVVARYVAMDGTIKLALGLSDDAAVETVFMPSHRPDRAHGCVSSQVGCAMGCDFCASTRNGLTRNLSSDEILAQFELLRGEARAQSRRLASIVFMGMGEPLLNLDNVLPAIATIADPRRGGIGWRHVTVSTVGIVPGIGKLAEADLRVHLALSLHAPDDSTRRRLIPAAKRYAVADIIAAAKDYQRRSRRVVTIEYCLLGGVNDSNAQAAQLAGLLRDWRVHVNVIPYNPTGASMTGAVYVRPTDARVNEFVAELRENRVVAHVRRTRGDDVNAACGQLAATRLTVLEEAHAQAHG
ncbi:MAG: 23S rRNA (adenine(2503)-C(2))-methyltransferase RlmN [Tepidisphaeraceae bacterium]